MAGRGSILLLASLGMALPGAAGQVSSPPPRQLAANPLDQFDCNGDPLPDGARARLGTLRLRHRSFVRYLAFSADGKLLATSDWKTVRIWEVPSGREVRSLETGQDISALTFSPDGRVLAAAGQETPQTHSITLWETANGKRLAGFPNEQAAIYALAFSPGGKKLAAVAREGNSQALIKLWSTATGKCRILCRFTNYSWTVGVAFAPDGATLASPGQEFTACLWDAKSGKCLQQFKGHEGPVTVVAFAPGGKALASGSMDGSVRLWNVTSGGEQRCWTGQQGYISNLAFSADGRVLASQDHNYHVRLWDPSAKESVSLTRSGEGGMALSPDGKLLALAAADKVVDFWEIPGDKKTACPAGPREEMHALAYSHDGKIVATSSRDGIVFLWDAAGGKALERFQEPPGLVAFAPDRPCLALAGKAESMPVWEKTAQGWQRQKRALGFQADIKTIAFSPDGKWLALGPSVAGPEQSLYVVNAGTGKLLRRIRFEDQGPRSVAFSKDGKVLACIEKEGKPGAAKRWLGLFDPASGKQRRRMPLPADTAVSYLNFASGGTLIAVVVTQSLGDLTAGQVQWWDPATGGLIRQRPFAWGWILDVAFSPDGRMLALACKDGSVRLWDAEAGGERRVFLGHKAAVQTLAFSPDGKALASGSADTTGLVWDIYGPSAEDKPALRRAEDCWSDLASSSAALAFRAMRLLIHAPQPTLLFLKKRLQPVRLPSVKELRALAANLDDDRYPIRSKAMGAFAKLAAEDMCDRATLRHILLERLKEKTSLELRFRTDRILQSLERLEPSPERLRLSRALEVIEQIATAEARVYLESLTRGSPEAWLTRDAEAAVQRLIKFPRVETIGHKKTR